MTLTPEQFYLIATKHEFNELKGKVEEISGDIKYLVTAMDSLVYEQRKINSELTGNIAAHNRFEERITATEKQLIAKPIL